MVHVEDEFPEYTVVVFPSVVLASEQVVAKGLNSVFQEVSLVLGCASPHEMCLVWTVSPAKSLSPSTEMGDSDPRYGCGGKGVKNGCLVGEMRLGNVGVVACVCGEEIAGIGHPSIPHRADVQTPPDRGASVYGVATLRLQVAITHLRASSGEQLDIRVKLSLKSYCLSKTPSVRSHCVL